MITRADFDAIIESVPKGSSILDIGCGDGELLKILESERQAIVRGMEISQAGVNHCVAKGLSVIQGDADHDLPIFADNSFDLVVLSNTIQAVLKPKNILLQIKRIGRRAIVSLPNFGYWKVRLDLGFGGRMPITKDLPETWYNTANLHLCTLRDFAELANECGFKIVSIIPVIGDKRMKPCKSVNWFNNLLAQKAVFVLERD